MECRPNDLLMEWKAGQFRPVYYLIGEEASSRADAVEQLKAAFKADDFSLREFSGDVDAEAEAVLSEAMTMPVFSGKRLVIVRNPKIPAAARASFAEYLKDPLKTTTLVLLSEERKADPKDALVRAALSAGAVCVYSPLREDEAQERLRAEAKKAGKSLSAEAAATIVAEAGTDWGVLRQELEKAVLFASKTEITSADALECLGYQKSADPFALARLILDRDVKKCLAHLRRLFRDGKPDDQAFRALSQISSAVVKQLRARRMLAAKVPPETIFKTLRLHSWWDKEFLAKAGRFSERRLRADAKRCLEAESNLKSKAWLDPRIELEHLTVDLCRRERVQALAARDS